MSREAKRRKVAWSILGVLLLVVNGFVLAVAAEDRSWGALGMAICVGPIANGVLALVSLCATPWMKSAAGSPWAHVAFSLGVPAAAIAGDFLLIMTMDLHGC